MPDTVRLRYEAMARAGEIAPDALQGALVDDLDAISDSLAGIRKPGKGALAWLRSFGGSRSRPRGLYIWGGVGRGKTLLMDLFFEAARTTRKRRVHFLPFMIEVQDGISAHRRTTKNGGANGGDPIAAAASELASRVDLLCFDEFAVYDIADAMILGRLFEQLLALGVTIVATSNVTPDELYKDGLNRALFLPFIALLKERMTIFHLDGPRDFRLNGTGTERRYVTPLGPQAEAALTTHFRRFSGGRVGRPTEIESKGRRVVVPEAAAGVAKFTFEELCSRPLGSGDYLKIADAFHTIILADVPVLTQARRNEAKRLIKLIDTLYDKRIRLVVSAEAEPNDLYRGSEGAEAFEFARTASRLIEMRSDAYWNAATAKAEMKKARADAPGPLE
jgi:cell division protein ZapE